MNILIFSYRCVWLYKGSWVMELGTGKQLSEFKHLLNARELGFTLLRRYRFQADLKTKSNKENCSGVSS